MGSHPVRRIRLYVWVRERGSHRACIEEGRTTTRRPVRRGRILWWRLYGKSILAHVTYDLVGTFTKY